MKPLRTENMLFVTGRRKGPLIGARDDANAIKEKQDTSAIFEEDISFDELGPRDVRLEFDDDKPSYSKQVQQTVLDIVEHIAEAPHAKILDEFQSAVQTESHAKKIFAAADAFDSFTRLQSKDQLDQTSGVRVNYPKHVTDIPTSERKRPNEPRGNLGLKSSAVESFANEQPHFKESELITSMRELIVSLKNAGATVEVPV